MPKIKANISYLENNVDDVVILSDDLQRQVDTKYDSLGKSPDGKQLEADGRDGKRFSIVFFWQFTYHIARHDI